MPIIYKPSLFPAKLHLFKHWEANNNLNNLSSITKMIKSQSYILFKY